MTDSEFTEKELKEAKAAIDQMTPEEYIEIASYLDKARRSLPEAGASITIKGFTDEGLEVLLTVRDHDAGAMIQEAVDVLGIAKTALGFGPRSTTVLPSMKEGQPQVPQLVQKQDAEKVPSGFKETVRITTPGVIEVTSPPVIQFDAVQVSCLVTQNGKRYLQVKGPTPGPYGTYGVKAWPEVLPAEYEIEGFQMGTPFTPPAKMAVVFFNPETKRVVAFGEKE